jgi:hypothetical protein
VPPQTLVNFSPTSRRHNFPVFPTTCNLVKRLYGGPNDRESRVRFPTAVNLFPPLSRDPTGSGLHIASYSVATAGSLP